MATSAITTDSDVVYQLSRFDDRNIEDPILRAQLHLEVTNQAASNDAGLLAYYIRQDEEYRPDLVAYRVWGVTELRWVVTLIAGNEDESSALPVGSQLMFPPATWLREVIRHYQTDGQILGTLSVS